MEFTTFALLLAQIAVILLVSRGLGLLLRVLGQPLVIAEMLAGIALGPSLLGLVWPQAFHALFPDSSLPVLKLLSQLGLVLFMFLIGLELDPALLRGRRAASVAISHTSIALPFALGVGAAFWLEAGYAPQGHPFLAFALFLGTAMSVTAFPVLARILAERQLLQSRVGSIALACAAVDDVTAWCLLAFVVAIARAHGLSEAVWTAGLTALFCAFMLLVARPLLRRLPMRPGGELEPRSLALVLLLLSISSGITEVIGIHALFGGFLLGAVMPKENGFGKALAAKLETVAVLLLLPLFFAYSGIRTRVGLISGGADVLALGGIVALATLGKFGGSAVAARISGLAWREASAIGVLMNTRGLMELIVLNVGMDLGVITPTLFTMLVLMALLTTFATTPILRWVYPERELPQATSAAAVSP